jgi:hypothetical protein
MIRVKRIVIDTPITTVAASSVEGVVVTNIAGIDTTGAVDGNLLIYNSVTENWEAGSLLNQDQIIDGRIFPSDSAHGYILIRRSGVSGEPDYLRQGEMAYSWLEDSGIDGFGNGGQRLYIGVGNDSTGPDGIIRADRLEVIGGAYFTSLLNHTHGVNTASSALIVDSNRSLDYLRINNLALINNLTTTNLNTTGFSYLDSTLVEGTLDVSGYSIFDSSVLIRGDLTVLGNTDFILDIDLDSTTINGDLVVNGRTYLNTSGNQFYIDSVQIEDYIDSSVNRFLIPGTAIDLLYDSVAQTLSVSAIATDSDVLGVASFNAWADSDETAKQFSVVNGAVRVEVLDGGFFSNNPLYPG